MRTLLGTILVAAVALFAGVATSAVAETVDLAEIEGDTLEVATLSNGIDYTNSSGSTKTLALNLSDVQGGFCEFLQVAWLGS